tara:strand:- start:156 stop:386 length:231 start_codon:yes stop_codon:yes gene_type:complete
MDRECLRIWEALLEQAFVDMTVVGQPGEDPEVPGLNQLTGHLSAAVISSCKSSNHGYEEAARLQSVEIFRAEMAFV